MRPEHLYPDAAGHFGGRVELFERPDPLSFAHLAKTDAVDDLVAQLPYTPASPEISTPA